MRPPQRRDGYLPIAEYGLIGDCRSAALVGSDASIDWLCLPRFDDPSIFGRLLDARRGGHWQIVPTRRHEAHQSYRDRTNLLQTVYTTSTGRVAITDFMPIHEDTEHDHAAPHDEPRLIRLVECLGGRMTLRCEILPAPDYGRIDASAFQCEQGRYHADVGDLHICIQATCPLAGSRTEVSISVGNSMAFALATAQAGQCPGSDFDVERAIRLMRSTREFWREWVGRCTYSGPYQVAVWRSALALKLMTYSPTGAIVAAPTTSLPEAIGGERNWDYRFTWLRDASFTLFAFFQLGLTEEAHQFFDWLVRTGVGQSGSPVDNLYTLDGHRSTEESALEHLSGYRDSAPVRIGNGAAQQLQLDVYGEVMDSAYLYARFGGEISDDLWTDLRGIVDLAIERWEEPDCSIWEVRGPPRHFTYSKVMCWVAVDRGLRIAEKFALPHDAERWRAGRRAIHRRVVDHGWSEKSQAFSQELGSDNLDASILRLAQVRFLPDRDPRIAQTTAAVIDQLREGELVRRYRPEETGDGLSGGEGAFLMCSFWLVDALAHGGDVEEAQRHFERLLTFASPLGLFAEEADPRTGMMLGNYPQAFTHLALVSAAVNIERARHRRIGVRGLT